MQNTIAANIKARLTQWLNNPKAPSETNNFTANTHEVTTPNQHTIDDSMRLYDSHFKPIDFQFDPWNQHPILCSHNHISHADYSQRLESLIQAMGSFMHRRDDWIVIDDPVMPGKSLMDALNLMGHG